MGTNAQVASLRQQVQAARGEAAQARRELETTQEYLASAHQRIDELEAENKAARQLGECMADAIVAAQELTRMTPEGLTCHWDNSLLVPSEDQMVVSIAKHAALVEALYRLTCFVEGKQPIGAIA